MLRKKKITDVKKPKKRMRSIWIVLLTSLITAVIVGGAFAGYVYYQDNFVVRKTTQKSVIKEDVIKGKNVVVATSNNNSIFTTYYNTETSKTITKKVGSSVTVHGGKWGEQNKNEVIQFSGDGKSFVSLEVKEPTITDKQEFAKFVKYSSDGKNKDILLESASSLAFGNFIYKDNKIYYLSSVFSGNDVTSINLSVLDVETKKAEVVVSNIGELMGKEISLIGNSIYSMYISKNVVYEAQINLDTKALNKNTLFKITKNKNFETKVDDISISLDGSKYLVRDYSQKDGYLLNLYDKSTKKTTTLKKDKSYDFDSLTWSGDDAVVYKKKSVFSSEKDAGDSIVLLSLAAPDKEKVLATSEKGIDIIYASGEDIVYADYANLEKLYFISGDLKKEFTPLSFSGIQDILHLNVFTY